MPILEASVSALGPRLPTDPEEMRNTLEADLDDLHRAISILAEQAGETTPFDPAGYATSAEVTALRTQVTNLSAQLNTHVGNTSIHEAANPNRQYITFGRQTLPGSNILRMEEAGWSNMTFGRPMLRSGAITGVGWQYYLSSVSATSGELYLQVYVNNSLVWEPLSRTGINSADFVPTNAYTTVDRATAVSNGYTFNAGEPIITRLRYAGSWSAMTVDAQNVILELDFD